MKLMSAKDPLSQFGPNSSITPITTSSSGVGVSPKIWNTTHHQGKPTNPIKGSMHFDTINNEHFIYDGLEWKTVGQPVLRELLYTLDVVTRVGIYVLEIYNMVDDIRLYEKHTPMKTAKPNELLKHINKADGQNEVLKFLRNNMGREEYLWVEKQFFEILC